MPRERRSYYSRLKRVTPETQAFEIVRRLRASGHAAYWVGGCVRDRLLGLVPKDFDVATSAWPEQITHMFPASVLVGVSFGVVRLDDVEIATFRSDAAYTDGRRPDSVRFENDPRADAARRDLTINAIFFEPLSGRYVDFFGGREDLERRLIRAVGEADARFAEDHLRLLRAVRFAARFEFEIEERTWAAILRHARLILAVSRERAHDELNAMFTGPHADRSLALLRSSGLLDALLPEAGAKGFPPGALSVPLAWAALLEGATNPRAVLNRFRFSHADTRATLAILASQPSIPRARELTLAAFKRLARQPDFEVHLRLAGPGETVDWIRARRQSMSDEELWPTPLLTGADLIAMGLEPGPRFRQLIEALEEAQLNGLVRTPGEALRHLGLA